MKATRRGFIGGAAAFAPFATRLWAAEAPLLKIGVMTDTHVGKTKESCSRARLAYEMFRDMGVDLIANVGDVADHHYPTGYTAYREMVEETFAKVPAVASTSSTSRSSGYRHSQGPRAHFRNSP